MRKQLMDIENIDIERLLIEGSKEFGVLLKDEQVKKILEFKNILMEWNQKINLTAIEEDRDIVIKHFIDSISILPFLGDRDLSLMDVGTGAGFPGILIKILYSNVNITLLDSLEKRVKFLNEVIDTLSLSKVRAIHGRAEDYGILDGYRAKFDVAVARAVASLPVLLEYSLPFVKVGGLFIAMKGSNTEEIHKSGKALSILGGEIQDIKEFCLPFSDIGRTVVIVRKLKDTPSGYPRKAGKPSKQPLI